MELLIRPEATAVDSSATEQMPRFAYKALTLDGEHTAGELDAPDRTAALRELATRGTCVTALNERDGRLGLRLGLGSATESVFGGRVRPKQLGALTRQLSVALEAGLPLITALSVIGQQLDHTPSRELLADLSRRVQQGASLSEALGEYPRVFSPLYVRLVRVAETSGALDTVLRQLADMLEEQTALRERVKTASIYPAILLVLGLASVAIIVTFIVPRIIETLDSDTFLLPWPTRVLMSMSDLVVAYWWLLLGGIAAVVIGWRQGVLRGPGRPWWDATKLKVPILGKLIREMETARFARNLGIMTHSGVTITHGLAVVRDTIVNTTMRQAVHRAAESIQAGESIAPPLARSGLFPPLLVQMVRVGENTGRLDEMLLRAADIHETDAKVTLDRLVNVLPVAMILLLACVIGFIVAGLVLAIVEFQATGIG